MFGSRTTGRSRRNVVTTLASLALAAGVIGLPATPAAAVTCKVNSANDPTESQIQDILDNAAPNATVTFSGTCFGNFSIDHNLKIAGTGVTPTVAGDGGGSVFYVGETLTVSFTNLTITDGGYDVGGGILADDSSVVTVTKVKFIDNGAGWGGALFGDFASTVNVVSSTFISNGADIGGAIGGFQARVTVTGSTFTSNGAAAGGAIFVDACTESPTLGLPVTISRSTFSRNVSGEGPGGAVWLDTVPAVVTSSTFSGNQSAGSAGALWVEDECDDEQPLTVVGSNFTANVAGTNGGAIRTGSIGEFLIRSSKFTGNVADSGGAIDSYDGSGVDIAASSFSNNRSTDGDGGAIFGEYNYYGDYALKLATSTFSGNSTTGVGGGVALWNGDGEGGPTAVDITSTTFTRNSAGYQTWDLGDGYYAPDMGGGALFVEEYNLTVMGSTFSSNRSLGSGGAILFSGYGNCDSDASFTRTVVKGNTAINGYGGGLFLAGDGTSDPGDCTEVSLESTTVSGNSAIDGGGVYLHGYTGNGDAYNWYFGGWLITDALTKIDGNRASGNGGGLFMADWHASIQGSISGNVAGNEGGGIYDTEWQLSWPEIYITNAKIDRNTAAYRGGGIRINGDGGTDFIVDDAEGNVSVSYNKLTSASGVGGGLYVDTVDDFLFLTDSYLGGSDYTIVVAYNQAKNFAGGFYVDELYDDAYLDYGVLVTKNSVGGFYDDGCNWLDSYDATITGNAYFNYESC